MKKIILAILFSIIFTLKANADVTPQYLSSVAQFGIGVAQIDKNIKIYEKPDVNSKMQAQIIWDEKGDLFCKNTKMKCVAKDIFLGFNFVYDIIRTSICIYLSKIIIYYLEN